MAKILIGLGGLLSDPACCVIKDGTLVSAVEQNKLKRQDRPGAFPDEALAVALQVAGITAEQIHCVALARPFAIGTESDAQLELRARFPRSEIVVVDHHEAHAASAYYLSGFRNASALSIDRAGDFRSAVLFRGEGLALRRVRELYFPDSVGDLFNRVTELLGFESRADEHKVQWLSASGKPSFVGLFRRIIGRSATAWPQFDRSYFNADRLIHGGFSSKFYDAIGVSAGNALSDQVKADIASSLQIAAAETITDMFGDAENVAISGGLALNALIVRALEQRFSRVFVQPASGNAGTALGAALHAWHGFCGETAHVPFSTICLGPDYTANQVKQVLENCKLRFHYMLTEGELMQEAVRALNENNIVAWMQGRMEFGPRALGNRSILASPLNPYSTENLNVYIKHRESFRKFAASVPEELASEYFEVGSGARYLTTVGEVRAAYREVFSGAILAGNLVRVHTVRREDNPLYHSLLVSVGKATGLPVLYNTSFNLFGDPLVCTPRDAVRSFYSSGIDVLFAGSFRLEK